MAPSEGVGKSSSIKSGMAQANAERQKWIASVSSGEVSFRELVEASKFEDYKALGAIRLYDLLLSRDGWTESTALESIRHSGFDSKDTVRSIRKSDKRVELFSLILSRNNPGQWRVRPEMPPGWPWNGKIGTIIASVGETDDLIDSILYDDDDDQVTESVETPDSMGAPVSEDEPISDDVARELDELFADD